MRAWRLNLASSLGCAVPRITNHVPLRYMLRVLEMIYWLAEANDRPLHGYGKRKICSLTLER